MATLAKKANNTMIEFFTGQVPKQINRICTSHADIWTDPFSTAGNSVRQLPVFTVNAFVKLPTVVYGLDCGFLGHT